ncbi:hypothetical protein YTPLAS18_17120 [Nitrospira sp.]|nr:hypothetical protein YTPLAS18_17120 [Nitrospira sp.]
MKQRKHKSSSLDPKMFPQPGPFRTPPPMQPSDYLDPKSFLPGGAVYESKLLTGPQSRERLSFITDAWVLDGLDAPSFIPDHLRDDVRLSLPDPLKAGGLQRRQQRLADEAARLREAGRRLKITRPGRPAGPYFEGNREQFEDRLKQAIVSLSREGERRTLENVARCLGYTEKTLQRDLRKFGYPSWPALRRQLTQ